MVCKRAEANGGRGDKLQTFVLRGEKMSVVNEVKVELLTTNEVARLLGCGARSVWRWSRSGRMPAPVRIGNTVRYRRREIEDWIANGCPRVDGRVN